MGNTKPDQPPWLVAKVLSTSRPPKNCVGVLLDRFQVMDADGAALILEQMKGGGINSFLGNFTAEADTVPYLIVLTLLGVDRNGGNHNPTPSSPYRLDLTTRTVDYLGVAWSCSRRVSPRSHKSW